MNGVMYMSVEAHGRHGGAGRGREALQQTARGVMDGEARLWGWVGDGKGGLSMGDRLHASRAKWPSPAEGPLGPSH